MSKATTTPSPKRRKYDGRAGQAGLAARFASPEEKSQYFSELAKRGNAHRLVLSGDERQALTAAYALLQRIAGRHGFDSTEQIPHANHGDDNDRAR